MAARPSKLAPDNRQLVTDRVENVELGRNFTCINYRIRYLRQVLADDSKQLRAFAILREDAVDPFLYESALVGAIHIKPP